MNPPPHVTTPTPDLLHVAAYIRNLLTGTLVFTETAQHNLHQAVENLRPNHSLPLAQLLVTAPVSDQCVAIACLHLATLCPTFATTSTTACVNTLHILLATVHELRCTKRYTTLHTIAHPTTGLCLDLLESNQEGSAPAHSVVVQLLQSQLL